MDDSKEKEFTQVVAPYIPQLITLVQQVIERYLSYVVSLSPDIYEDDPLWVHSGDIRKTGMRLSEKSDFTLQEISQMHTGNSGYGMYYATYGNECGRLVSSCLYEFAKAFIKKCLQEGKFSDYLVDVLGDENEYDNVDDYISYFASEFSCDELECWEESEERFVFSVEDLFGGEFGEQKISQVCLRYELELARFFRSEREFNQKYNSFEDNARQKAQQIAISEKFHRKIEKTPEDKEIRKELESLYSVEDLALLFHFGRLHGSNSYAKKYFLEYNRIRWNACGKSPSFDDFLEDFTEKAVKKMLGKQMEK